MTSCLILLAVGVLACSHESKPKPAAMPTTSGDGAAAPAPDATPAIGVAPIAVDAATATDAAVPVDAAPRPRVERQGRGSCRRDDDCVLTTYQEGCCVQGCSAYASSKAALAARQAKEDCAAFRASGEPCPPPAPCRRATEREIEAVCKNGRCYGVYERI